MDPTNPDPDPQHCVEQFTFLVSLVIETELRLVDCVCAGLMSKIVLVQKSCISFKYQL